MSEQDSIARLLDAHVAHELAQLHEGRLAALIDGEIDALFAWLAQTTLDDVTTSDKINAIIERYVIDLKISGALTELAGEMSRLVVASQLSERTRVDQLLRPEEFAQFADKLAGLEHLWRELLHLVVESDAYASLLSRTLQRSVLDALFRSADSAAQRSFIDGLIVKLRPVVSSRIERHLSAYLEQVIKRSVRRSEERLAAALDVEAVRSLVDDVWTEVGPMRLSDAFGFLGAHDLEDFVVLGYEFWQRYRKSEYFRGISRELVGYFFEKYGEQSLLDLLDEVGVTKAMVQAELQGFLAPLVQRARASGLLEQRIRAHLERFYRSDAASAALRGD